jgi:hypothetical protein
VSAIGVLVGAVGMFRLAQLGLGSSYLTVWPFYVLVGSGYGLAVPAIAAAAMGTVPGAYAGTGSGILSASRQVGTTLGLAVLGSISVAAVSRAWDDRIGGLPPAIRDEAGSLVQRVAGREGRAVGQLVGPETTRPAFETFLAGLHAAMWVAAAAMLAAVVAFVGLRPDRAPAREA